MPAWSNVVGVLLVLLAGCASGPEPQPDKDQPPTAGTPPRRPGGGGGALEAAKKRARDGDVEGAVQAARQAVTEQPRSEEAHLLLASLLGLQDDTAGAVAAIDEGLSSIPSSAALHHAKGMTALESDDLKTAVDELEQARTFARPEQRAEILADLAYAYLFSGKTEDAEKLATESRALDPKSYAAAFTHGEALLRLGRFADAAEAYQAAATISPDEVLPRSRLVTALMKSGNFKEAVPALEALLPLEKENPARIHAALAQSKLELGQAKEAVKHAQKAVELQPDEDSYRALLADCQDAAGDKKGAKATRAKLRGKAKR